MGQEKELEMGKEDLDGKPDNIKEKIVAGAPGLAPAARMRMRRPSCCVAVMLCLEISSLQ